MELTGRRRNGSTFPAEISLSAIETDEGTLITAAVRDVSDRLAAQAERERLRVSDNRTGMTPVSRWASRRPGCTWG
jgi:hypothetical protein